jgi:hypothetical protein
MGLVDSVRDGKSAGDGDSVEKIHHKGTKSTKFFFVYTKEFSVFFVSLW